MTIDCRRLETVQYIIAILVLLFLVLYVVSNIIRYPWHTLVFVVSGLAVIGGGSSRLYARLKASPHPAARQLAAAYASVVAIGEGTPPYNEPRWWVVRSLVQVVFWAVLLAAGLAVLVVLGGVFVWLDKL